MRDETTSSSLQMNQAPYLIMHNPQDALNGIDLFYLIAEFYKKRWLIISITTLCTLLSLAVVYFIPPQYQINTHLIPPNPAQYQNLFSNTDQEMTQIALFKQFIKKLSQNGNFESFLQESSLIDKAVQRSANDSAKSSLLKNFPQNYTVSVVKHSDQDVQDSYNDNSIEAELSTTSSNPDLNAKNHMAYLTYTNHKVLEDIIRGQRAIAEHNIRKLEQKIQLEVAAVAAARQNEIKRLSAQNILDIAELNNKIEALKKRDFRDRELRLNELHHALKIAEALGITTPKTPQDRTRQGVVIEVNQNKTDLYLKGSKYLKNEIALTNAKSHTLEFYKKLSVLQEQLDTLENNQKILALKSRINDEPYVANLEAMQIELRRLQSLSFDISGVSSFQLDGKAIINTAPIKPNKNRILILGCGLGFMLATLFVLTQAALNSSKKKE